MKLIVPILMSMVLSTGCGQKPELRWWMPPTAEEMPHNWLRQKLTTEIVEKRVKPESLAPEHLERWISFKSHLQPEDEVWYWETSPFNYNQAQTGYCIVRKGKVVEVYHRGLIMWMDHIS